VVWGWSSGRGCLRVEGLLGHFGAFGVSYVGLLFLWCYAGDYGGDFLHFARVCRKDTVLVWGCVILTRWLS
jgi:hypothetical protein